MSVDQPSDVDDPRWLEARDRAEFVADHGPEIELLSMQIVLMLQAAIVLGMGVLLAVLGIVSVGLVLQAIGFAITLTVWIRARRRHHLEPFGLRLRTSPLALLNRAQRRTIRSQLRGRAPVQVHSARLVDAVLRRQQEASRHLWPALLGYGCTGVGASITVPWLLFELLGVGALVALVNVVQQRRVRRVRAAAAAVIARPLP